MKTISIFGSTGSIGQKSLRIAKSCGFKILAITCKSNYKKILKQAQEYHPKYICITDPIAFEKAKQSLSSTDTILLPHDEIKNVAQIETDCCIMAISGIAGLDPTFACIGHTKRLAIATKEVIISAGNLLINYAIKSQTEIIPIDSEHNAIFQCLLGEDRESVKEIIITASGGPFLELDEGKLGEITISQALNHPNWSMGQKNTIDSATLINKALEIIEASYLFDIPIKNIRPLIHKSSLIHGLIRFHDGAIKALMSFPDMVLPISYALNFPHRKPCNLPDLDFEKTNVLSFSPPKPWQQRNINLAYDCFQAKNVIALNMANEYAVKIFLEGRIKFCDIYKIICNILEKSEKENITSFDDIKQIVSAYSKILSH